MSRAAVSYVANKQCASGTMKFVLVALAEVADERGMAFPSLEHIRQFTCLDRKTIVTGLDALTEANYIRDTGERRGRTRQIKVYQIAGMERVPESELFGSDNSTGNGTLKPSQDRNGSESGTVPDSEPLEPVSVPKTERFTSEESRNRNSSENGTRNQELQKQEQEQEQKLPPPSAHAEEAQNRNGSETGTLVGTGGPPDAERLGANPALAAAVALRQAGYAAHQFHPKLVEAVEAGCSAEEILAVAAELEAANGARPDLAYVCRTAAGRRRDAGKKSNGRARASPRNSPITADLSHAAYAGTPSHELPTELQ